MNDDQWKQDFSKLMDNYNFANAFLERKIIEFFEGVLTEDRRKRPNAL